MASASLDRSPDLTACPRSLSLRGLRPFRLRPSGLSVLRASLEYLFMSSELVYRRWTPEQDPESKRTHCVSVRMNASELAALDARRGEFARGEYMRFAFFSSFPPSIPELNREAWVELSRAASNLNQLAKHVNEGGDLDTSLLLSRLADFRSSLIGAGG